MAPIRNEPRPVPTPTVRPTPTPAPAPRAETRPAAPQSDRFEEAHNQVSQVANGAKSISDGVASTQVRRAPGPQRFGPFEIPGRSGGATVEGVNTRGARWAGAAGTAASVAQLPGAAYLAFRDTRDFFRNPSGATANKASRASRNVGARGVSLSAATR